VTSGDAAEWHQAEDPSPGPRSGDAAEWHQAEDPSPGPRSGDAAGSIGNRLPPEIEATFGPGHRAGQHGSAGVSQPYALVEGDPES
jgi:hypothetical protein